MPNFDDIPILFEDNHLLVVVKPPNLLSQADRTGDPDLLTTMKEYIKIAYEKPGNVYLGLVHRLDRPVGGVMVLAKTSKAAGRLAEQLRSGAFTRRYLAIVQGQLDSLHGTLNDFLLKDSGANLVRVVDPKTPGAKEAKLEYHLVDQNLLGSLIAIELNTGRAHQIRVQMAALGHPLLGDQRYGPRTNLRQQIALWAEWISLLHPTTKERLEFRQDPPKVRPWVEFKNSRPLF